MIERKPRACGAEAIVMTACPICGKELPPQARTADHIGGHSPDDLGL